MTSKSAPLRIFCLHGYRQSGITFRQKTGSLRKILKNKAELIYMTAPNLVPRSEDDKDSGDQYGWWFSQKDDNYNAQEYTNCCNGYEESLKEVAEFMKTNGPFHGIIAFSQGAAFLSLICGLKEKGDQRFPFRFAIFVAGFKSRQAQHQHLYDVNVTIPTLHVIGDTDQVIPRGERVYYDPHMQFVIGYTVFPTVYGNAGNRKLYYRIYNSFPDMSDQLLELYQEPVVLRHPGGHFVPTSAPQKAIYIEFLKRFVELI